MDISLSRRAAEKGKVVKINLDELSKKELVDLKKRVDRAVADYEDRKKSEAIAALEAKAKALGYSLNDLLGTAGKRKRKPAKPKYANPANKSETWTGRGRKPRWVVAVLASGKSLDDIAI
ncbi:MAG: H-NS histone family protein [Paracoccaceae bacterium]|nr:H-NS histone family protein [Paracoccaceae bacterium]